MTDIHAAIARGAAGTADLTDLAALLSVEALPHLEQIGRAAQRVTVRRFGRTVHLFAPLYLSNDCLSTCTYCGFSKQLEVRRRTLTLDEVEREARHLVVEGFRHVLLVSAEHGRDVGPDYLERVITRLHPFVPSLTVETQVWDEDVYRRLVRAGAEGVVIYQETYDRDVYARVHVAGKKRDYDFRAAGPDRAARAGARRVGIGALLGLSDDWRAEVVAVAAHARRLAKEHWRTEVTASLPRLRPSAAGFPPLCELTDREYVQAIAALRLVAHDVGIVLSTREEPRLRDGMVPFGVTHMSAGSHTEPGGYEEPGAAEAQFAIADQRSPATVAAVLRAAGYDPVWKDWSPALSGDALERI